MERNVIIFETLTTPLKIYIEEFQLIQIPALYIMYFN